MLTTATSRPTHEIEERLAPLAGDWSLWRDFAVRSAGFPVSGLEAFGPGDEPARLRGVARDPLFREAVTWQNPAAFDHAVVKVVAGASKQPSQARRREEVVASYWQRYCAKNDTIGFFGPLAWGRIAQGRPRLTLRAGALERERALHFEAWGIQSLAGVLDPDLKIPTGPHAERDLRTALEAHTDSATRTRGLEALARLEAARDKLAAAPPDSLRDALAELDATFVDLTGREPIRNHGRAYGARTLVYIDSMRDLDMTLGGALIDDIAPGLHVLFEAGRWYCGQVQAVGRKVIEQSLPPGGRGPFAPVLGRVLKTLMQQPQEIDEAVAEMHQRLAALLSDPDPATIGLRAMRAFAGYRRAWPTSVFQSVDLQLAASDQDAIAAGDYLAVVGDFHPGANPLVQGLFAHRHPDPPTMRSMIAAAAGPKLPFLLPPFAPGLGVDARGAPATREDDIHIAVMPDTRAPGPRRTWLPDELLVDGDFLVDRSGTLRLPLLDAVGFAIFIAGVRAFELLPEAEHTPRVAVGQTILRREGWSISAGDLPTNAQDAAAFARDRGMPRRLFAKSPLERKPMYLDTESPTLTRILCRHARRAAAEAPNARFRFTEMLPTPDQCWLTDPEGNRFVSELRLVAVDRTHERRQ